MRKVIKLTESELKKLIGNIVSEQSTMDMNEYSEGFMNKIINKFKQELTSDVELYVNRFKEISKNLENRDISTYSFEQLKQTVDSYVDGYEKDSIKSLHHSIDREVQRNLPRGSKEAQDRYREDMVRRNTQGERPSFSDRYKN
jgi:predicted AlkP superfamily phosphohydrolase/phosphomutase